MTHYANDYFDFEADRANQARTRWSGGSGVLARGELPAVGRAGRRAGAWPRSGLPSRRSGRAGPWAAAGAVPVGGGHLRALLGLQRAAVAPACHRPGGARGGAGGDGAGAAARLSAANRRPRHCPGCGCCCWRCCRSALLQVAMLLAVEFPDARSDALVGKRTLVVRLGCRAGRAPVRGAAGGGLPGVAPGRRGGGLPVAGGGGGGGCRRRWPCGASGAIAPGRIPRRRGVSSRSPSGRWPCWPAPPPPS